MEMDIGETSGYFHRSREWRPFVAEEAARSVAENRRSIIFPPRQTDGRVEVLGYHAPLKVWVVVIVVPVGGSVRNLLHNGYVEWNHKEEIRKRARRHRWR